MTPDLQAMMRISGTLTDTEPSIVKETFFRLNLYTSSTWLKVLQAAYYKGEFGVSARVDVCVQFWGVRGARCGVHEGQIARE